MSGQLCQACTHAHLHNKHRRINAALTLVKLEIEYVQDGVTQITLRGLALCGFHFESRERALGAADAVRLWTDETPDPRFVQ